LFKAFVVSKLLCVLCVLCGSTTFFSSLPGAEEEAVPNERDPSLRSG
jgi:hypothetical protein